MCPCCCPEVCDVAVAGCVRCAAIQFLVEVWQLIQARIQRCCGLGLVLGVVFCGHGIGAIAAAPAPREAICGYAGSYRALEAGAIQQGLTVEMLVGDAAAAQPVPLRFRVIRRPTAVPVDDLQVEHEKLLHVIGVREDLASFVHLHPQRTAPGLWEIVHTFSNAGRYQFWTDIKQRGTVLSFAQPRLLVAGEGTVLPPPPVPKLEDAVSGFRVTLNSRQAWLVAGRTNFFEVSVRDPVGNPVGTEFYLGALMHVIIIKDDLSVYTHAHATEHEKSRQPVSFQHVFPQAGDYKIFAQFRPQKTPLPTDGALLAQFWVRVVAGI